MNSPKLLVLLPVLGHEGRLALGAEEAGGDRHGAAGVEHVDHRFAVVGSDLHGGVRLAGGGAADQQRQLEPLPLHLARHVGHLIQRGGDEAGQADEICLLGARPLEDLLAGHHHAHVDDLVVVAGQHHADDVLADVVHVAFDRGEHDLALRAHRFAGRLALRLLRLHVRHQVGHGLFHHARRLHHLGQEHLAGAEQIADHAHPVHERTLDNRQRPLQLLAGLFGVGVDVGVDSLHQGVREPLFHGAAAPLVFLLLRGGGPAASAFSFSP